MPHRMFIIHDRVGLFVFPIYLIASSHAIIFSRVVQPAAGQYRDNPLCRHLCVRACVYARTDFLTKYFSLRQHPFLYYFLLFSSAAPLRLSMFCFPAVGAERPKLFQVYLAFLPLLHGPALRSPFCFHRRATSCGTSRTFLPLFDPAPFLFMHRREHSQLQCIKFPVCMQITSSRIFLRLLAPPACYFPVNSPSFLPSFRSVNICCPPNSNRHVISPLTERERR